MADLDRDDMTRRILQYRPDSLTVTIPREYAQELRLKAGQFMRVDVVGSTLIIAREDYWEHPSPHREEKVPSLIVSGRRIYPDMATLKPEDMP